MEALAQIRGGGKLCDGSTVQMVAGEVICIETMCAVGMQAGRGPLQANGYEGWTPDIYRKGRHN